MLERTSCFVGHASLSNVAIKQVCYSYICVSFALFKLLTILIMATGGLPQSQLSLVSCCVEEKRSTRGPLGLDTTQRETEAMRPADLGRASPLYTPSTLDDLSCYEDLRDRPKTGDNVGGYETEKAAVEPETKARRCAVTVRDRMSVNINH